MTSNPAPEVHAHGIGDPVGPSDVIAERIKDLRRRRGLTAEQLAARCAEVGAPKITTAVIANIETGRPDKATGKRGRVVTVEELLIFAYILDVAPLNLMTPINDLSTWYSFTPKDSMLAGQAREWIRGNMPMGDQDPRGYFSEVPAREWQMPAMTPQQIERESAQVQSARTAKGGGRRGRR